MDKRCLKLSRITWIIALSVFVSGLFVSLFLGVILHFSLQEHNTQFVRITNGIAIFSLFSIVLVEILAHFFNKEANWNTFVAALGLFIFVGASMDTVAQFLPPDNPPLHPYDYLLAGANQLGFLITIIGLFRFFESDYKVSVTNKERVPFYIAALVSVSAYIPLLLIHASFLVLILDAGMTLYMLIKCLIYVNRKKTINVTFVLSMSIAAVAFTALFVNELGLNFQSVFFDFGFLSISGIIASTLFYAVYLVFVVKKVNDSYQKEELERQTKELQSVVLKEQIKPHFVFNALNAIKLAYQRDQQKGEDAIDLFSKYLRSSTEAGSLFLVPLEKELSVISWYVELENLKVNKPYEVIFNIDAYDFQVPYFGLQPLVENAIRYGRLAEKEDGHVEISSFEEESCYKIIISDNGVGFDPFKIDDSSYGIGNTRQRFKLLLNATFEIGSKLGEGSTITITIPKGGKADASDSR